MVRDQLVEPADPRQPFRQPAMRQPTTRLINDLNVVMGLSPVITHKKHSKPPPPTRTWLSQEKIRRELMDQGSNGTTSHQR